MAQVSLKSYCDEVRDLIKGGAYDKALVTGRYILQHYPKYVEAYSLLAEACLAKGQYDEASDLFARVLSVDPENVEARLGMSKLFEAEGNIASAILQMREAFDLAPSQTAIRSELHRLLDLQGSELTRLKLTRQGLGRIYLRGGLYTQAADEFETLLRENPDQVDVEVSLAEALWRDGQMIRSVEVCQSALNKLPYCLKANLILAETWMRSDREDEGETHLQRVRMVDPEGELVYQLIGESTLIPRVSVMLTRMGQATTTAPTAEPAEALEEEEVPAWLKEAGPQSGSIVSDLSLPAAAAIVRSAAVPGEAPRTPAEEAGALEAANLPDWLKKVRTEEMAAEGRGITAAPSPEAAQPDTTLEEEAEAVEGEMPPWLMETAVQAGVAPETTAPAAAERVPPPVSEIDVESAPTETATASSEEQIPSWLSAAAAESTAETATEEEGVEEPEWLQTLKSERGVVGEPSEIQARGPAPESEDEVPDWLSKAADEELGEAEAPAASYPPTTETEEGPQFAMAEDEEPDWRRILREEGLEADLPSLEQLVAAQTTPQEEPGDLGDLTDVLDEAEIPDWLREAWSKEASSPAPTATAPPTDTEPTAASEIAPEEATPAAAGLTEDEAVFTDWLREASEAAPTDTTEWSGEEEVAAAPAEEEFPDWLREVAVTAPTGEAPPAETPAEAPEEVAAVALVEAEEIPDWLRDVPASAPAAARPTETPVQALGEAAATTAAEEEVPDWLRLLREEGLESELPSEEDLVAAGLVEEQTVPAPTEEIRRTRAPSREELIAAGLLEEPAAKTSRQEAWAETAEVPAALEEEPLEAPAGSEPSRTQLGSGREIDLISQEQLQAAGLVQEPLEPEAEPAPAEDEEIPDWLRLAAQDEGLLHLAAAEAGLVPTPAEAPETPPVAEAPTQPALEEKTAEPALNWLDALRADGIAETILPEAPVDTTDVQAVAVEEPALTTGPKEGEITTWMRSLLWKAEEAPLEAPATAEPQIEAQTAGPAEPIPDWMKHVSEGQGSLDSVGDVSATAAPTPEVAPDWFAQLRREAVAAEEAEQPEQLGGAAQTAVATTKATPETRVDAAIIAGFESAIQKNHKDYLTRWKLAQAYASSGNHEAAITHSQKLLEADEMAPQVAEYLKVAINSGVKTRQAYQLLGDACFKSGQLEEALDAYRKALSLLY